MALPGPGPRPLLLAALVCVLGSCRGADSPPPPVDESSLDVRVRPVADTIEGYAAPVVIEISNASSSPIFLDRCGGTVTVAMVGGASAGFDRGCDEWGQQRDLRRIEPGATTRDTLNTGAAYGSGQGTATVSLRDPDGDLLPVNRRTVPFVFVYRR